MAGNGKIYDVAWERELQVLIGIASNWRRDGKGTDT